MNHVLTWEKNFGSMYVSVELPTYPSPNLTCFGQNVRFGEGRWAVSQKHTLIQNFCLHATLTFMSHVKKPPLITLLSNICWPLLKSMEYTKWIKVHQSHWLTWPFDPIKANCCFLTICLASSWLMADKLV